MPCAARSVMPTAAATSRIRRSGRRARASRIAPWFVNREMSSAATIRLTYAICFLYSSTGIPLEVGRLPVRAEHGLEGADDLALRAGGPGAGHEGLDEVDVGPRGGSKHRER